jgi:hypothetical protein
LVSNRSRVPPHLERRNAIGLLLEPIEVANKVFEDLRHFLFVAKNIDELVLVAAFVRQGQIADKFADLQQEVVKSIVPMNLDIPKQQLRKSDVGNAVEDPQEQSEFVGELAVETVGVEQS